MLFTATRRLTVGLLSLGAIVAGGCTTTSSNAAEPPSTIGLGSDIDLADAPQRINDAVSDNAAHAEEIDHVVMVGDSITKGATPQLEEQFVALGLETTIESEQGKRMAVSSSGNPSGATIVEQLSILEDRNPEGEVWVIALGTNDIAQYTSPDEIAAAVNEVLADVPDEAAVVWVDTYMGQRPEQAEAINTVVRERIERRGNGVIAPWTSFAALDGVLTGDGVHPTTDGAEVFASVVTNTVATFLGR